MRVFPSSGSSRYKAPLLRSRLTRRFQSSLVTMNAKLFEERTVFKISTPTSVERICLAPDFQVPTDTDVDWIDQSQPDWFPVRQSLSGVYSEHVLATDGARVALNNPSAALARMLYRWLLTRPLPVAPAPIGYCRRNCRFVLRFYFHIEQSLQPHHFLAGHALPLHVQGFCVREVGVHNPRNIPG